MVAMKPILFNTEMVRAILDGRKTVTRRVVKPQPNESFDWYWESYYEDGEWIFVRKPCQTGDILYVRETFAQPYGKGFFYAADYQDVDIVPADCGYVSVSKNLIKWSPSIHMPKEAARIFLRVTGVRVERLQEITPADAEKEGVGNLFLDAISYGVKDYHIPVSEVYGVAKEQFAHLWDSTIKKADRDLYDWVSNPFVWVINFEQCENPKGE